MKRSSLWQTAWLTTVILWGGGLFGGDAPVQREDIGRALEMYRWLVDHEEFSAAGKLAAELQSIHPDDPQVQLIVENAQLRAAVREANRVLVDDHAVAAGAPPVQWEMVPPWETFEQDSSDPFRPDINWRELGNITGSGPVLEPVIVQTSAVEPEEDAPPRLFDGIGDWDDLFRQRQPADDDSQKLSTEARIWMALTRPVSMHFTDAPLSDIVRYVADACDVNVVVDEIGLQDEGLTPDAEVTIAVDGIQAKSALKLVLQPLNLAYTIENEVVYITSRTRQLGELITRVYSVPDLVTPIPHQTPGGVREQLEQMTGSPTGEFDALTAMITHSVQPDSWSDVGGQGSVHPHERTLSLIIRQTESVHEEIGHLLSQVRRLRDVQVSHVLHRLSVPVSELDALGLSNGQAVHVVAADETTDYESQFLGDASPFEVQALPRITLFNRQTGTVADTERTLLISSIASPDRRSVRINVAVPESLEPGDVMSAVQSVDVPDGGMALIVVSDAAHLLSEGSSVEVLAVTPRIQVREEEEELLGIPTP